MAVAILGGLVGLAIGLALIIAIGYAVIFRRPLPRTEGTLAAAVRERVEITRDADGVPHVLAESHLDASFAVGFLHGQERLWQMELQRRIAAGRLSEVIGNRAVAADRLMRRLGLLRVSEAEWHVTHAASELRPLLEAYAAGVNAAIADRPLPAEFTILRHRPEPWTPEDSLAVGRFLSFGQAGNWEAQLVRARLLKELGPEMMRALEPTYDDGHPRIPGSRSGAAGMGVPVRRGTGPASGADVASETLPPAVGAAAGALLDELEAAQEIVGLSSWAEASNSWVLHGSRTASGKPILASDPHSVITMPSAWFQVHVTTPEDEVAGLTFSGSPFVLVGHNRHIAWGLVNSGVSIQGLYVERFNPNNPLQFDDGGKWEDAVRFREVIHVRGGEPVVEDVLVTRRGPVIGPAIAGQHPPLTLRWTGHDSEVDSHSWVMRLNRARSWPEFRAAVGSIASPSLLVTYVDTEGNIGYRMSGFIPIRLAGQGRYPARGWDPGDEWQGFVPFEEMPEALNPADGYLVAANNPVAPGACPYPLVTEGSNGYRAQRLVDVVGAMTAATVEESVALQADVASLPGAELRDLVLDRVGAAGDDADLTLGLGVLSGWDAHLESDSAGAVLYARLTTELLDRVLGEAVSEAGRRYLFGGSVLDLFPQGPLNTRMVSRVLALVGAGRTSPLAAPDEIARDRLLAEAVGAAVAATVRRHGDNPVGWRWGDVNRVRFDHPIAVAFPALSRLLSRGPFPSRGDNDTVRLSWSGGSGGIFAPVTSAFWRAVYTTDNWSDSVASTAPGQSGHPASPHYGDMIEDWLRGRPRPLTFGGPPPKGSLLVLEPVR
jgi:penicillin amidase